ncbi:hypothetical protein VM636_25935 [Streptomyces sp. SCSIO 75703]|uniref:hypothetical protein n=1 Tax=unclassified Streptomyces TaxID=2593676 RepID=UPI0004C1B1C6|nr:MULTISPECIES: hypothetical protein [unclassified Streptomyces]
MLTINVAVLLAVVVVRRPTEARSRSGGKPTVVTVPDPRVLIAPAPAGRGSTNVLGALAGGSTRAGR